MSEVQSAAEREFIARAQESERLAAKNPKLYRWRVLVFALLGYFLPPLIVISLGGILYLLFQILFHPPWIAFVILWIPYAFMYVHLIYVLVRAFRPLPQATLGRRLEKAEAPELFSRLENLRQSVQGPQLDNVYLTGEFGALLAQRPLIGLLGWYRNELVIGLPLFFILSKSELETVLAHELCHSAGGHGKLGSWIWRAENSMMLVINRLSGQQNPVSAILSAFYRWYQPRFQALTFAMSRENEYEADRLAAAVTSAESVIDVMMRLRIAEHFVASEFWGPVWARACDEPEPPALVYQELKEKLSGPEMLRYARPVQMATSRESTDYLSTHPSLPGRAKALGVTVRIPPEPADTAFDFFAQGSDWLVTQESESWQADVRAEWHALFAESQKQKEILKDLDRKAGEGNLSSDEILEWVTLAERLLRPDEALSRCEECLRMDKDNAGVLFRKGRLLLELDREEGVDVLNQLAQLDPSNLVPCYDVLARYHLRKGRESDAVEYKSRADERRKAYEDSLKRPDVIYEDDSFQVHDYKRKYVEHLAHVLNHFTSLGVDRAWLVRKAQEIPSSASIHFLVCELATMKHFTQDASYAQMQLDKALKEYDDLIVIVCEISTNWLRDKVAEIPDAQVFPLPDEAT